MTACTQVHAEANKTGLHRAPPELWPRLGREEVRGPSSEAVSAGVADTAAASAGAADSAAASAGAADTACTQVHAEANKRVSTISLITVRDKTNQGTKYVFLYN